MTKRNKAEPFEVSGVISRRTALQSKSREQTTIRSCTKCLTPETEEAVKFDENGICNICKVAMERDNEVDWDARLSEFESIVAKHRGKYSYDAIVPFSGGKDSSWTAYLLRKKFNLKNLLVTFDSHLDARSTWRIWSALLENLDEQLTIKASDEIIKKTMKSPKRRGLLLVLSYRNCRQSFQSG